MPWAGSILAFQAVLSHIVCQTVGARLQRAFFWTPGNRQVLRTQRLLIGDGFTVFHPYRTKKSKNAKKNRFFEAKTIKIGGIQPMYHNKYLPLPQDCVRPLS